MSATANRIRLLVVDDQKPTISPSDASADSMLMFLEEVDGPNMRVRIGTEVRIGRVHHDHGVIDVTRGESYPGPSGRIVTGGRYLMRDSRVGGRIVGALNFTIMTRPGSRDQVVISNLVVDKGFRRQGVATKLLATLQETYPQARVDSSMTADGAAFFGYAPGAAAVTAAAEPLRARRRP